MSLYKSDDLFDCIIEDRLFVFVLFLFELSPFSNDFVLVMFEDTLSLQEFFKDSA